MEVIEMKEEMTEFRTTLITTGSFESAVIIFQDEISELDRQKFNLEQWIIVWLSVFPKAKIKKVAWKNISQTKASFEDWSPLLTKYSHPDLKDLILDKILEAISTLEGAISYYGVFCSADRKEKLNKLLNKLKAMKASSGEWLEVLIETTYPELKEISFAKIKQAEDSTFKQWAEINSIFMGTSYEKESLDMMVKKAKTFSDWDTIHERVDPFSKLAEKASKEKVRLAKTLKDLTRAYLSMREDLVSLKEEIETRILGSEGELEEWLHFNQSVGKEDKMKEVSLNKMKESAKTPYGWDVVFHRSIFKDDKREALLKVIELAEDARWLIHAYAHATDLSLKMKIQKKLQKIAKKDN